jgi:hypothetical protein
MHALEVDRRVDLLGAAGEPGLAGSTLVPLDDDEVVLPLVLEDERERHHRGTRPTVEVEQHREFPVLAAGVKPLRDAPDFGCEELVDALVGIDLRTLTGPPAAGDLTPAEGAGGRRKDEHTESQDSSCEYLLDVDLRALLPPGARLHPVRTRGPGRSDRR